MSRDNVEHAHSQLHTMEQANTAGLERKKRADMVAALLSLK